MPNVHLPRLLISVRNLAEARIAVASGCDLLDMKEPNTGSLGMVAPDVACQIASEVENFPLSMALGESRDWLNASELPPLPSQLDFVKLGLAGMNGIDQWQREWIQLRERWSTQAGWIAVAYADHNIADAPAPAVVVSAAIDTGCRGVLFDTFAKRGRTLFDEIGFVELRTLIETIHAAGLIVALAGSLRREHLPQVCSLSPDVVAVRGAVCDSHARTETISSAAVKEFREALCENTIDLQSCQPKNERISNRGFKT